MLHELQVAFRDINAAERWVTSEHFHLHAGYQHSKTVPSLSPSRPLKVFDPVNIITGESARAARQRDSTMRENCREKDESGRYRQQFGAKVMLMFSEPLPTWARRWWLLSLLIYFTQRLRRRRRNWGSTWSSPDPSLLEEPFHSSLDCSVKQVRNGNKLQKTPTVETLDHHCSNKQHWSLQLRTWILFLLPLFVFLMVIIRDRK